MTKTRTLPQRCDVDQMDTWDLSSLFANDEQWEEAFGEFERRISGYDKFKGHLGDDAETLFECLQFDNELDRLAERIGVYALLKTAEDQANSTYQRMIGRFHNVAARANEKTSFIRPEILSLPKAKMKSLLADQRLQPFQLLLQRLMRYKKHTLGKKEEALLAMQSEMAGASSRVFRQLHDADMKFGTVTNEKGERIELSNATFGQLLVSSKRRVRHNAFHQYYSQFAAHENTFAATLSGSILTDVYYARARRYRSSLDAALFPDKVPGSVYENLIATVRKQLPSVHHYYEVRRQKMRLKQLHFYDTYVPILTDLQTRREWNEAVGLTLNALKPLGSEYCAVLETGLRNRWCDRYPNTGKQSGAFSCGSFDANPYILMNYKPDVFDDVFTLAHEAGHSMHSYYSARHQPYTYYNYSIFVAEVASTFNEQLLGAHLQQNARGDDERAYLINRELDAMRATIVRQTMFAEFEKTTHEMAEAGEPLTVQTLRDVYGQLLKDYLGPAVIIDDELTLECLRIPHFYRAFYVYKYATGMSAAIALSQRVLHGGERELSDYLEFLKSGCIQEPLTLLKDAGVDMTRPEPIETALTHFGQLVDQLDATL